MNDVITFLQQHDKFLLLTHCRPDGDTLGSAAGLCAGLRALGKTAYLWANPEITERYRPFTEPYFPPEGYRPDAVVSVDTASAKLLPETWKGPIHLRIDHHPGEGGFAQIEYTDPASAACGEVVYTILSALGVTVTAEMATPLYIAVSTDTGGFRYANTTPNTHRTAAALMDAGIDAYNLNAMIFSRSRSRMAIETVILENLRFHAEGRVAIASLSQAEKKGAGAKEDDLENIAGLAQNIDGVCVGFMLREEKDGWRVSCRTAGPYAANRICQLLGGGGHEHAGGGQIKGGASPEEAREQALAALRECYPDLA